MVHSFLYECFQVPLQKKSKSYHSMSLACLLEHSSSIVIQQVQEVALAALVTVNNIMHLGTKEILVMAPVCDLTYNPLQLIMFGKSNIQLGLFGFHSVFCIM